MSTSLDGLKIILLILTIVQELCGENKTTDNDDDDTKLLQYFVLFHKIIIVTNKTMKIDIHKFLLFVMMTTATATAVAADSGSSSSSLRISCHPLHVFP